MSPALTDADLLGSDALLDALACSAAGAAGCPMALVALARGEQLWFKGRHGLAVGSAPLEGSFCGRTLQRAAFHEVEDARAHPEFAGHPMVTGPPFVRFYAGIPLWLQGRPVGTLCVMGTEPMRLHPRQLAQLHALAACVQECVRERSALAECLGRLGHELRTPLNAVLGFSQLLLSDAMPSLSPRQAEWARHLQGGGVHLLSLVDDMLRFSRLQLDPQPLTLQALGLDVVVERCLGLLQPLAAQAQVALRGPAQPSAALVCAEERALQQVLLNLLGNAVKYSRPGGSVTVTVEAHAGGWLVHVADEGPGLAPEQVARLFRPFDRLGAEHSGTEGNGLGLSIARMLADAMHATLRVRSSPGAGSVFTLGLQRAPV